VVYRLLNRIRFWSKRFSFKENRFKPIKCFVYKGEYKWRNCLYIEENIKEIRAILVKARIERRNGKRITAKAYFIKDINISLDDSILFTDNEDIALKLPPRKSFTIK
jgi:phosphopantetheinyl transferase (holo-ACP synthase)